ncbi:MAG: hypothetical protein R3199_11815 [Gemmatimonadota bacterium]|nr:hypothetical protein [Gemmatimonadota bacterium]
MSPMRKVYLPKWITWFGLAFVIPTWLWVTYRVFFTEPGRADLGVDGWVFTTLMMGIVLTILILMGKRKLPAYLLELEEDEE